MEDQGSQQVTNSFGWSDFYWHQYLAQNGYIVVCVDNRGTGGKGAEFKINILAIRKI